MNYLSFQKVFWLLLLGILAVTFFLSLYRFFDHDEFEAVHSAWKMMHGEQIYVDFANQHHPFFYYVLMAFIRIFGETTRAIMAMRICIFAVYMGILWLTYRLACDSFEQETARMAVLFLATALIFLHKVIEIRPDVPQTAFGIAGFMFFTKYLLHARRRDIIISAVLMATSFLFLQKALFAVIIIGGMLLIMVYRKTVPIRDTLLFAGVFIGMCLPYLAYLFITKSVDAYIVWSWIINMKLDVYFPPYKYMVATLRENTPLWLFFTLGIIFLKTTVQKFFGATAILLMLSIFLVPAPSRQYYMMALPFVAVVAAVGFKEVLRDPRVFVVAATAVVIIPVLGIVYDMANALSGNMYNKEQLEQVDYVLSITNVDDYVYDGDIEFNVYRRDLDFFWFSVSSKVGQLSTYKKWRGYDYDIYRLINEKKPKVISLYTINKDPLDPRIANMYTRSKPFPDLYIRTDNQ
jgi:4-amino-4-deoxy-L-arabinose transferase-like glycosyltransferase